ncbi:MAG: PepSY domain-containing protein [Gammaproteobacteria bacterium]|jgi:hypothetical protein|nr:PepSY domain-containing protein [Gammaproteobacteria bacterium]MDH3887055.1 PepSY domain-containing protein [Gammaproteobacteria bacterium]MDH3970964.1 PepSY domain-containing protein [Gammaproteobacteria bacterium]MDH3986697.1 PepSY domain-containing protein [Gammaproteobacteria bacterium]
MTRHNKKKSRARLLRSLYIWHRYIGISTAIFVIILSFSGLVLNHTDELNLDAAYVQSDLLLDWYGITAPEGLLSYTAGSAQITAVNDKIFWDNKPLLHIAAPLAGVQAFGGLVVIVAGGSPVLFTAQGELVEKLENVAGVPTGIQAIGLSSQGLLAVKTVRGIYLADENLLEWVRAGGPEINWSSTQATEPALLKSLQNAYRGTGLPIERIMLDLHSGRILGRAGVYIMDAAAIGFLLLAASGVWLWLRRRASIRAHRQKTESSAVARS